MKIVKINSRFLTQKLTGSQRFAIEISRQLKKIDKDLFQFVSPSNILHKDIAKELNVEIIGQKTGHLWEQIDLPLYLNKKGKPFLLNLVNSAPLFYKNNFITVHDVSWYHYPDAVNRYFYYFYKFLIPKLLKKNKLIFTVSEYSKQDISNIFNVDKAKFVVIYNAVDKLFFDANLRREKIILSVSSLQKYKNFNSLIEAFLMLKKDSSFSEYNLTIVGNKDSSVFNNSGLSKYYNRKDIVFTGHITDVALNELYNKAELFVFPSKFEGFGIPPLEAMKCGCPVISSNAASLPEVCGAGAVYFDPENLSQLVEIMRRVINENEFKNDLISKGRSNTLRFSWENSANIIYENINKIINI